MCRAPQDALPCAVNHDIGPASEPRPDSAVSNPIQRASGEKFLRDVDLPEPGHGAHPGFVRFYRASRNRDGVLGRGWMTGYDLSLQKHPTGWRLHLPNGQRFDYDRHGRGLDPGTGWVTPIAGGPDPALHHRWQDRHGQQLDFDQNGRLQTIRSAGRSETHLVYHETGPLAGQLRRVTRNPTALDNRIAAGDPATLTFHYALDAGAPRLQRLETPLGDFHYHTDTLGRIQTVRRPDGMLRRYHYEALWQSGHPHHITGISLESPEGDTWRARTWIYDSQGRVITAAPGSLKPSTRRDDEGSRSGKRNQGGASDKSNESNKNNKNNRINKNSKGNEGRGRIDLKYPPPAPDRGTGKPGAASRDDAAVRYDRHGRLAAIAGLTLARDAHGRIRQLKHVAGGWPGLQIDYDERGRRSAWSSALTGRTQIHYDAQGRLAGGHDADGRQWTIRVDDTNRPIRLTYRKAGSAPIQVDLRWRARQLIQLHHPDETEYLDYTADGRLRSRTLHRPHPAGMLKYHERLDWTESGQLKRHHLPEGGSLHYEWARGTRLSAITWQRADGTRQRVIHQVPGLAGYRSGNGLHLQAAADRHGQANTLMLTAGSRLLWGEFRQVDDRGLVVRQSIDAPALAFRATTALAYDGQRRLIRSSGHRVSPSRTPANDPAPTSQAHWYGWHPDGSLLARQTTRSAPQPQPQPPGYGRAQPAPGPRPIMLGPAASQAAPARPASPVTPISRRANGEPAALGERQLVYQAQGRLAQVVQQGRPIARYTHNARGQQIRQQHGAQETERYYLDNRFVAQWHRPAGDSPSFGISQRYIYAHDVPVGLLQTDASGQTTLFYIHADLLGAPVLVTDQRQRIRWAAHYDALGKATRLDNAARIANHEPDSLDSSDPPESPEPSDLSDLSDLSGSLDLSDLRLSLRRPGQDEDPVTGWHDNVFRTYLPQRGQYLEPDPLGPLPDQQALGYAAQRPLRFVDPLGLILLAFDGTRLSPRNQSNVWKLGQVYADGPVLYKPGPGNSRQLDWDALVASSSQQIQRSQWQALLDVLAASQGQRDPVPIDILGYSRGAALARDFANRIAANTRNGWFSYDDPLRGNIGLCIDMRFLGLFETVAQFGLLGAANAGFDLSIDSAWAWVAHAVALHERRSLFPLVSAIDDDSGNAVEAPFIGAHADIGGGLLLNPQGDRMPDGDLSDVALNWMRWQALAAHVPMADLPALERTVTQALLHDERLPAQRLNTTADRMLQDSRTRPLRPQGDDDRLGDAQRQLFDRFIQRVSGWRINAGTVVGVVDMRAYDAWLQEALGFSVAP